MSNQAEPNNNVKNESKYYLTTELLGIADANAKDLAGFMLNPRDISTAVMKILLSVGIKKNAVRSIKVGCDNNRKLKIIVDLRKKHLVEEHEERDMLEFDDYYDDDQKIFPKEFYKTLKNKVYSKHLNYRIIKRRAKKGKTESIVQLEFDPEILIAFVYNLNFNDEYYRISCVPQPWLDNHKASKKHKKNKDADNYYNCKAEYTGSNLRMCVVVVTFSIDKNRELDMYKAMIDKISTDMSSELGIPSEDAINAIEKSYSFKDFKKALNSALSSGDFHPSQVAKYKD